MGCWSESCALSGMEIKEDDEIYVALFSPNNNRFNNPHSWDLLIPPIKGTYDEYGGINLIESNEQFGLETGQNWRAISDEKGLPVYLLASVFEYLPNLKIEFPYFNQKRVETLGEYCDLYLAQIRNKLETNIKESDEVSLFITKDGKEIKIPVYRLYDVFGNGDIQLTASNYIRTRIDANNRNFDEFFKFYYRALLLSTGQFELRKRIVPKIHGPQHSGEKALLQFYKHVMNLTETRIKDWEDGEY